MSATYSGSDKRIKHLFEEGGGGGGSSTLAGLEDVNISSPSDGDALIYDATNDEWVNGQGGGGGGGTSVTPNPQGTPTDDLNTVQIGNTVYNVARAGEHELTKAEYDALPQAEQENGDTYYIKDAVALMSVQPLIFSDEEREVGVWRDGKPLYQKTLALTSPASTSETTIYTGDSTIDIKTFTGYIFYSSGNDIQYVPLNMVYVWTIVGLTANKLLQKTSQAAYCNMPEYVTIWYTKTTDTAGSGVYVPSGLLAVHYSMDEQVVGTWIDGSAIYEKTIEHSGALNAVSDWTTFDTSVSYGKLLYLEASRFMADGSSFSITNSLEFTPRFMIGSDHILKYYTNYTYNADYWYITVRYTKSS